MKNTATDIYKYTIAPGCHLTNTQSQKKWKYKKSGPGWSTLWCHLELPPQSPLTIILIHLNFISIIPWEICDHTLLPLLWWRPQYLRVTNRYFGEQLAEASEVNNGRQVAQKYEQQILLVEVTLVRAEVRWPWTDETKNVGSCLTGSAPVLVRLPLSALALRISWTECPGSYCMCVSACVCVAPWVLWTDTWLWAECFVCADLGPSVSVNRYVYAFFLHSTKEPKIVSQRSQKAVMTMIIQELNYSKNLISLGHTGQ